MNVFARKQVVEIIDQLLQHPDALIHAVTVENSEFDADTLLSMVENNNEVTFAKDDNIKDRLRIFINNFPFERII